MSQYNPKKHHRRSIRLKGYDYSRKGMYFITLNVKNGWCLFGHIKDKKMILNPAGKVVAEEWLKILARFPNIRLHEYVVMPNHFHALLEIVFPSNEMVKTPIEKNDEIIDNTIDNKTDNTTDNTTVGATLVVAQTIDEGQPRGLPRQLPRQIDQTDEKKNKTIGDMVGAYKSIVTNEYIIGVKNDNWERFDKKLWQRNYYESIIRSERSYYIVSNYIRNNPAKWDEDMFHPNK